MDDKEKPKMTGDEDQKYEAGREGKSDILGTDSETEQAARERGKEDRINAEQTQKEKEESEEDDDDDDD